MAPVEALSAGPGLGVLKFGLLTLWTGWFTIVVCTNVCDALKALGVLPQHWSFASENFARVREAISVYSLPHAVAAFLYAGVIAWQLVVSVLFWRALIGSGSVSQVWLAAADLAFTAALGLWAAFLLAEEVFKQYETEGKHVALFMAQLLTLIAIHVLPD